MGVASGAKERVVHRGLPEIRSSSCDLGFMLAVDAKA
jgi:hypothetical protein